MKRARLRQLAAGAPLFALALLAYLPVLDAGFIWDDDAHVTAPALRTWSGLGRIWFDLGATQQYYPLLHSLFWIEHRLWGDWAVGYHGASILMHAACACLFAAVLRRLAVPGAFLAAAVFAVHPMHVESVAWISEQKNTLSTLLCLGAAIAYLRFDAAPARSRYLVASALFALALLAKTVTATLPAALLAILWWKRGPLAWRDPGVTGLLPWLAAGLTAGVFTAWVERTIIGAQGAAYDLSAADRLVLAGRVVWFYLGKLSWPVDLVFFYPRWTVDALDWIQWLPLAGACALGAGLWRLRTRTRAPFAALAVFVASLAPVLGFLNVYPFRYSFVADHFVYLPSLAFLALVIGGISHSLRAASPVARRSVVAVIPILVTLTWHQAATYRDAETLYRTTIARNPDAWIAHNNLGKLLLADRARHTESVTCFERAIELEPEYFEARTNLAVALTQAGQPSAAIVHAREAVRLRPDVFQAHNNLGIALASSGYADESLDAFRRAAELNPRMPNIHENWAKALLLLGRRAEAAGHFDEAARLRAATGSAAAIP